MTTKLSLLPEEKRGKCPDIIPAFGQLHTDHMVWMKYHNGTWETPKIIPRQNISLDPFSFVLHYAGNVFEGQKAMRHPDGSVYLFRPHDHAKRINKSFQRMLIPAIDPDLIVKLEKELIGIDYAFVPTQKDHFLYIRPNAFATTAKLGLNPPLDFLFTITLSPCPPIFGAKIETKKLMVTDQYARSVKGGTGEVKTGGNYAPGMLPKSLAIQEGCIEVLYANDGISETNASNFYIIQNNMLITPHSKSTEHQSGIILDGITKRSVLEVAKANHIETQVKDISLPQLINGIQDGSITEMGIIGTAAVITPIYGIVFNKKSHDLASSEIGPLTLKIYNGITDIFAGRKPDTFHWMEKVEKIQK